MGCCAEKSSDCYLRLRMMKSEILFTTLTTVLCFFQCLRLAEKGLESLGCWNLNIRMCTFMSPRPCMENGTTVLNQTRRRDYNLQESLPRSLRRGASRWITVISHANLTIRGLLAVASLVETRRLKCLFRWPKITAGVEPVGANEAITTIQMNQFIGKTCNNSKRHQNNDSNAKRDNW